MDPVVKAFLNSLKCPVCKSQIDLFQAKKKDGNNFACVQDYTHYAIFLVHWEQPLRIESEDVRVYKGKYLYDIKQHHYLPGNNHFGLGPGFGPLRCDKTTIIVREIDKEFRIIEKLEAKSFEYDKVLFDFQNTSEQKIINRVKTILVFQ